MNPNLVERFAADCRYRGISSLRDYVSYSRQFCTFMKSLGHDPLKCDRSDLIEYLMYLKKEREVKQATVKRAFTVLSSFYTFLMDEGLVAQNPIPTFQRRYLRQYKEDSDSESRKIITIEEAALLINSILDSRDKAIAVLFFKTGMRCGELCRLDVDDVDLATGFVRLKNTAKRSNRVLPIDDETIRILRSWLISRRNRNERRIKALFVSRRGTRLGGGRVRRMLEQYAAQVGLHDPKSKSLEDRFTPHCCRHWFTTYLIRAGMPRDFVKELRGDVRREAIDIYNHIDREELRRSYLAHIPQLGV